jgi:hypothetical protein
MRYLKSLLVAVIFATAALLFINNALVMIGGLR